MKLTPLIPAVLLAVSCCLNATAQRASHPGASRSPDLVIRNCQVVSVNRGNVVPNQLVAISDGVISYVGPAQQETEYPATTRVIDGSGKFLMPGLIDMHVHIGHPSELTSWLLHGVTSVCNLGGDYVDLFSDARIDMCDLRAQVASGQVAGPRIFTAGQALDGDPRTGPYQRALAGPAAAVEAVLEQKARGFDFIKVYDAVDEPTLEAIIRTARESGLAVIGHIPEQPGVEKTLSSGIQLVAHAEEFYPVFDGVDDIDQIESTARELAARVKQSGVSVIPNTAFVRRIIAQLDNLPAVLEDPRVELLAPRVRRWWTPDYNWYTGREDPEEYLAETRAKYRWLIPLVRELHRAGVPLLTGTDAAIPGALPGYAMFEEFRDLQSAGFSSVEILQSATLNSGNFLHEHAEGVELAQVREGYAADLLLLDRNPLGAPDQLHESIIGVVFNGRYLTRDELQQRLDEQTQDFR